MSTLSLLSCGTPVADALHAVAIEDLDSVIAEAGFEIGEFARVGVVGAQLVDVIRRGCAALSGHSDAERKQRAHDEGRDVRDFFHALHDIAEPGLSLT